MLALKPAHDDNVSESIQGREFHGVVSRGTSPVPPASSAWSGRSAPRRKEDAYPTRAVTIIVPFPAGGSADLNARTVAERLSAALGQPFIVENKAGASGNVGTAVASKAAPDGYTLLMSNSGALTVNPHIFAQVGYDPLKDFAPVSLGMKISNLLLVHPSLPVRTLPELIAYVKAHPGTFYGHSSGSKQLSGEAFRLKAGLDMPPVAYKGAAPMMNDLLSGQIKIGFDEVLTSMQQIKAGKLDPDRDHRLGALARAAGRADHRRAGRPARRLRGDGMVRPAGAGRDVAEDRQPPRRYPAEGVRRQGLPPAHLRSGIGADRQQPARRSRPSSPPSTSAGAS